MRTLLFSVLLCTGCATAPLVKAPGGFHFGVATSGFQSEGSAPDSNWRRYASDPRWGHRPVRDSVDFLHRFKEDVALARGLGVNTFRFSVEWARVVPRRGVVDEAALAFYDALFDEVAAQGMTPMVTLLHFVVPGWVADEGGLTDDRIVEAFTDFVRLVGQRYRQRGVWWLTLNEATHFLTLERRHGAVPDDGVASAKERLVRMHARAFEVLHAVDPGAPVSTNVVWEPAPASWVDDWLFDRVRDRIDYVAFDYYYSVTWDLSVVHAARGEFWKVRFTPGALLEALREYAKRAPGLPLYVVENGMATDDGRPRRDGVTRSRHLTEHFRAVQQALGEGLPVVGFNVWSLTDNYEWGDYRNRFGLYTVDVEADRTLRRRPTDAVETYRALIEARGVP
jgi:beta-glucosidase